MSIPLSVWIFFLSPIALLGQGNDAPVKLDIKGFGNLYKVNAQLYRSGKTNKKGMMALQRAGIKSILNLRNSHSDKRKIKATALYLYEVPINTWKISYTDILLSLKLLGKAEKPVLVHCLHGADRTGCIVAAYRMVYEDWPREKAIEEFLQQQYGYHEQWFPNILALLRSLDIEKLKKDLTSP